MGLDAVPLETHANRADAALAAKHHAQPTRATTRKHKYAATAVDPVR